MSMQGARAAAEAVAEPTTKTQAESGSAGRSGWSWGLDPGYFVSREALLTLLIAGGASAWTWEETDERHDSVRTALDGSRADFLMDLGNVYGDGRVIGGLALASLGVGQATGHAGWQAFGADLSRSFVYGAVASTGLKVAVDRRRPSGGSYSFPSGHTTSAFSTVPVIWHHAGWKVGLGAGTMASLTALGRMEENRHFASDVIAGAALGLLVGRAVVRARSRREMPDEVVVAGRSVALVWRF